MITLNLESTPEAERHFALRLFLRDAIRLRCPHCRGRGQIHDPLDSGEPPKCGLCFGRGHVTFSVTLQPAVAAP